MAEAIQVTRPYYAITVGIPAAVVRSYKQPLYDSEVALAAAANNELVFYQRPIGQTNSAGVQKTLLHTNMRSAGSLGVPISFDLFGFNVRLPKNVTLADYQSMYATAVFEFTWGTDTVGLQVPLEEIPTGIDTEGFGTTDTPHNGWGVTDNYYRYDVTGRALHFNSRRTGCAKGRPLVENPNNGGHLAQSEVIAVAATSVRRPPERATTGVWEQTMMRSDLTGDRERLAETTSPAERSASNKDAGEFPNSHLFPFRRQRADRQPADPRVHARDSLVPGELGSPNVEHAEATRREKRRELGEPRNGSSRGEYRAKLGGFVCLS